MVSKIIRSTLYLKSLKDLLFAIFNIMRNVVVVQGINNSYKENKFLLFLKMALALIIFFQILTLNLTEIFVNLRQIVFALDRFNNK